LEWGARLQPLAGAKGIRLDFDPRGRARARADRLRTDQVLSNLVSNAIKFTGPGGGVDISARARGQVIEIEVQDSGIGIRDEDWDLIFEEFAQVDNGQRRAHEGTGLGLPLSRRLVELMGGTLHVRSHWGEGSTFLVRLPRAAPPRRSRAQAHDPGF